MTQEVKAWAGEGLACGKAGSGNVCCWPLGSASESSTSPRVPGEELAAASFQPVPTSRLTDPAALGWHLPSPAPCSLAALLPDQVSGSAPVSSSRFCPLSGRALLLGRSGAFPGLPPSVSSAFRIPTPHEVWPFPMVASFPQTSVRATRTQLLGALLRPLFWSKDLLLPFSSRSPGSLLPDPEDMLGPAEATGPVLNL